MMPDDEAGSMDLQSLMDLLEWAKGNQRDDMANRYGKSAGAAGGLMGLVTPASDAGGDVPEPEVPEEAAEGEPVPGVETDDDSEGAPGADKLKATLAAMRAKG